MFWPAIDVDLFILNMTFSVIKTVEVSQKDIFLIHFPLFMSIYNIIFTELPHEVEKYANTTINLVCVL